MEEPIIESVALTSDKNSINNQNEENEEERCWNELFIDESEPNKELFLKNISCDFEESGLKNIAKLYGKITSFRWPIGQSYAFIAYENHADAENALCSLRQMDHLNFSVEFSKGKREWDPYNNKTKDEPFEHFVNANKKTVDPYRPLSPHLDMEKRKIKGPFDDPVEFQVDSLISPVDYTNSDLLKADPTKEFLWNSSDERSIELKCRRAVHGRRVHSKPKDELDIGSLSLQKPMMIKSNINEPKWANCLVCGTFAGRRDNIHNKTYCSLECIDRSEKTTTSKQCTAATTIMEISPIQIKHAVKLTHIINHRMVFVRPGDVNDDIEFIKFQNDVIEYAENSKNYESRPSIGTVVLAYFGGFFQRALVLKHASTEKVIVAFIDFGNVEVRNFTELKMISLELLKMKRFATKFILKNVNHDLMDDNALEYLYNWLIFDIQLTMEKSLNECGELVANLKTSNDWISNEINSLNTKLITSSYAELALDAVKAREATVEYKSLSGTNVPVLIMDNSLIPSCRMLSFIHVDDIETFHKNDRRIQAICNFLFDGKEDCYSPLNGEYCVFRYGNEKNDKRWYRGHCVEISFDGFATLTFLDYGNIRPIDVYSIRRMPAQLLFDCITMCAYIETDTQTKNNIDNDYDLAVGTQLKEKCLKLSHQVFEHLKVEKDQIYQTTENILVGKLKSNSIEMEPCLW